MRYGKIESKIWNDEKFTKLSTNHQRLFLYLLTCPHGNLIGCFVLKKGYASSDLGITAHEFIEGIDTLIKQDLIEYDKACEVLWLKNFLKHNPLSSWKQWKGADRVLDDLPKCDITASVKKFIAKLKVYDTPIKAISNTETYTESESNTESKTEQYTETNTETNTNQEIKQKKFDDDSIEIKLAGILYNHILQNNSKFKLPNMQNWAKEINKMLEIDSRTESEIINVIQWCQQDDFWKGNILGAKKLREKFDQLWIKMNGAKNIGKKRYENCLLNEGDHE